MLYICPSFRDYGFHVFQYIHIHIFGVILSPFVFLVHLLLHQIILHNGAIKSIVTFCLISDLKKSIFNTLFITVVQNYLTTIL